MTHCTSCGCRLFLCARTKCKRCGGRSKRKPTDLTPAQIDKISRDYLVAQRWAWLNRRVEER